MKFENGFLRVSLCCLASQILFTITEAVYPVPGSYYSVLLRYNRNNRGKTRKVGRVAPSPVRLWAYFDPPATLGALPIDSIDNNIARHLKDRGLSDRLKNSKKEIPQNFITKNIQEQKYLNEPNHKHKRTNNPQSKKVDGNENTKKIDVGKISMSVNGTKIRGQSSQSPSFGSDKIGSSPANIRREKTSLLEILKKHQKNKAFHGGGNVITHINGTCGSKYRIPLSPSQPEIGYKGRVFSKTVQTIGFPETYSPGTKCTWDFEVSKDCQMGMMVHEIEDGRILQSRKCSQDFLQVTFNGRPTDKVCGALKGRGRSHKWTRKGRQLLSITFESGSRNEDLPSSPEDDPWGLKITVSGYCWLYSTDYLMKLKKNRVQSKHSSREKATPKIEKIEKVIQRINRLASQARGTQTKAKILSKNLRKLDDENASAGKKSQDAFIDPINAKFINKTVSSVIDQLKLNRTVEESEGMVKTDSAHSVDQNFTSDGKPKTENGRISMAARGNYSSNESATIANIDAVTTPLSHENNGIKTGEKREIIISKKRK